MEDTRHPAACIILARGGSVGVPRKNLQTVGGVSLVGRAIRAGASAKLVTSVYVSTDDPEIAAESVRYGAQVITRPEDISNATASSEAGWLHALETMQANDTDLATVVMLQCTSPFTTGADIDACVLAMRNQNADCALSVVEDHGFLWQLDADGFAVGQNHDHLAPRQRRQDMSPQYRESGAIYCVDIAAFKRVGRRFCGSVAISPVDHPPFEIDTHADLELCRQIANQSGGANVTRSQLLSVNAIAMDFDGVHTDNLVSTDQDGHESVTTSRGDGMGLSLLRQARAMPMIIVSKERNPVVLARAKKLNLPVQNSVDDKVASLSEWLGDQGLNWADLLYVGNDVNDLPAMAAAGLSACPSDSHESVLAAADWILPKPGGQGALRAMCDALLRVAP